MPFEVSNIVYIFIISHGLSFVLGLIVWANLSRLGKQSRATDLTAETSAVTEAIAETSVAAAPAEIASETGVPDSPKDNRPDTALVERNIWLERRIAAVETELALKHPPVDMDAATDSTSAGDGAAAIEEQLARLRWRNRYLEGRVAYYEEGQEDDPAEAQLSIDADGDEDDIRAASVDEEIAADEDTPDAPLAPVFVTPEKPHEEAEPAGGKDDLTLINGIGPRIADVLNNLGIWRVEQVSGWTPENIVWLERHFAFHGRISREDWVGQAGRLLGDHEGGT